MRQFAKPLESLRLSRQRLPRREKAKRSCKIEGSIGKIEKQNFVNKGRLQM